MSIRQRVEDWRLFTDKERAAIDYDFGVFIASEDYARLIEIAEGTSEVSDSEDISIIDAGLNAIQGVNIN